MAKGDVEFSFDPFELVGLKPPEDVKKSELRDLYENIANYVLESVLSDVGDGRSPVNGRAFKGLSKDYKKEKVKEGGQPIPNLELHGDMMSALFCDPKRDGIILSVADDQMDKADGHNNFSGKSKLPERKFIPDKAKGETFRPEIRNGIRDLIEAFIDDTQSEAGQVLFGETEDEVARAKKTS
jgi:hypothetical protein